MNYNLLLRLLFVFPTLIGVTFITYSLIFLSPGDPAEIILREQYGVVDPESSVIMEFKETHGFNDPIIIQYGNWLLNIITGNFGISFRTGKPVLEEFFYRCPVSFQLAFFSEILALMIALPLGIISACKKNTRIDQITRVIALFGMSIPIFWLGAVALLVFSLYLNWVHVLEDRYPIMLVLPVLILTLSQMGTLMRLTRAGMLETLNQNYIRTARGKGVSERDVIWKHALRNALIPVLTIFSIQMASLVAGTAILETIFTLNGVGSFLIESIYSRDIPVIQGFILIIAIIYIFANFLADILYCIIDPRVRISGLTQNLVD